MEKCKRCKKEKIRNIKNNASSVYSPNRKMQEKSILILNVAYSSNCDRRLLKDDTGGAETISLGNEFHTLTTRLEQ